MKILVVTNLFPPHHLGGYELACQDVSRFLATKGHDVRIVTSTYGVGTSCREGHVHRVLDYRYPPDPDGWKERGRANANRGILAEQIRNMRPDVVFVFNPSGLGRMALSLLHEQHSVPVVHEIADFWLPNADAEDTWAGLAGRRTRSPLLDVVKRGIFGSGVLGRWKPAPLDLGRSYFRSRFLRGWFADRGLDVASLPVIHHGIDARSVPCCDSGARAILHMGRMCREKGTHVFLEALALLGEDDSCRDVVATLVGPCEESFRSEFDAGVGAARRSLRVEVLGMRSRAEALEQFRTHSILAFPVVWDEPFGLAPLEAMAGRLAVVATGRGGSGEFCRANENCLLVPAGDAQALAAALRSLLSDPELRASLGRAGIATAEEFGEQRAMEAVERHLVSVVAGC